MTRFSLLLALLLPSAAADDARSERLAIARLALDARLKIIDLSGKDKRAECLRAVAAFEAALDALDPPADVGGFRGRLRVADNPVGRALAWLAAHQDETGAWDADGFMKHDPEADRCDGKGAPHADLAATGLATLAFLGAGHLDRGGAAENPYAENVRRAVRFLMSSQAEDGSFVPAETPRALHANAIATLAMCDAFAMTRNPRYRRPAEKGLAHLLKQQTPGAAWRIFDPKARDASTTAWCVSALASARAAGIEVPERALADALTWVGSITDKETGRAGEANKTEWATAACLLTRSLCGQGPRAADAIPKGAALCAANPPRWNTEDGTIDMDYWLWGTLALFRAGGESWTAWSAAIKPAIEDRQQAQGSRAGSWDPAGVEGGRVEATARMALCLEVYYRYASSLGVR